MSTQAAAVEAVQPRRRQDWAALGGSGILSAAVLVSGLLAYAFQVLCARVLGADAFGQLAVLWATVFLATVILFRPIEQTLSRSVADRMARGEEVRTVARAVGALAAGVLALLVVVMVVAWEPLTDRLFLGNETLTMMLALGVITFGASYVLRGTFGGARWFPGYGLVLVSDAVARLLIAIPLLVTASVDLAAAALAFGAVVGTLLPLYVGRHVVARTLRRGEKGTRFDLGAALRFAAPASGIAAADQLLVNGAPILVMLEGGDDASRAAGVVFAATMLVRVPVYLFQGLAASLLPNLTRMQATVGHADVRRAVTRTVSLLLAVGAVTVLAGATIGPAAMQVLFGAEFRAGHLELALLGAGVGCYLAAATISQALLALERATRAAVVWIGSAALFVALFVTLPGSELGRVSAAFAVATFGGLLGLGTVLWRVLATR
jgi:O-antigen/teichoic acid export membrane protein